MKRILIGFVAVTVIAAAGAWMHRTSAGKLLLNAAERATLRDAPQDDPASPLQDIRGLTFKPGVGGGSQRLPTYPAYSPEDAENGIVQVLRKTDNKLTVFLAGKLTAGYSNTSDEAIRETLNDLTDNGKKVADFVIPIMLGASPQGLIRFIGAAQKLPGKVIVVIQDPPDASDASARNKGVHELFKPLQSWPDFVFVKGGGAGGSDAFLQVAWQSVLRRAGGSGTFSKFRFLPADDPKVAATFKSVYSAVKSQSINSSIDYFNNVQEMAEAGAAGEATAVEEAFAAVSPEIMANSRLLEGLGTAARVGKVVGVRFVSVAGKVCTVAALAYDSYLIVRAFSGDQNAVDQMVKQASFGMLPSYSEAFAQVAGGFQSLCRGTPDLEICQASPAQVRRQEHDALRLAQRDAGPCQDAVTYCFNQYKNNRDYQSVLGYCISNQKNYDGDSCETILSKALSPSDRDKWLKSFFTKAP